MLTIWGRTNSVNVQKVLWVCEELGLSFERIDAGLQFGRNTDSDYLDMNPMGRVPTLVDDDYVLWESNSIVRYLVMQYGGINPLYPADPKARASIDRWLDWALSTLQPAERPVFWGIVRTPEAARDAVKIAHDVAKVAQVWAVLDTQLKDRAFIEGACFTIADIVIGAFAKRWFGLPGIERCPLPNLQSWYQRLATRSGFRKYVDHELS
jgi:glutathione S-transferase